MKEDGHPTFTNQEAIEIQVKACETVSNETGVLVKPSMDMAASEFWDSETKEYVYAKEGIRRSTGEQVDYVAELIDTYGYYFVEDPIREGDFEGFADLTKKSGKKPLSVVTTYL